MPSLHTRDDSSCDTASDDGSPVPSTRATQLTGAQSGRRLCPTSFRFRRRWQRRSRAQTAGTAGAHQCERLNSTAAPLESH